MTTTFRELVAATLPNHTQNGAIARAHKRLARLLKMRGTDTAEKVTVCDGYKLGHKEQYPDHTEGVQSNLTARASRVPGQDWVIWFSFQHFAQKFLVHWMEEFFLGEIDEIVDDYVQEVNAYLGTTTVTGAHIRKLYELGYLPLDFKCLPEGSRVPLRVPFFIVENTIKGEDWAWLVNYFETLLSCELWGPCTSATTAVRFRELFDRYAVSTGSPLEFCQWQGHDFSMRGMFGFEASKLSGIAHLVAFTGTDTIPALREVRNYYDTPPGYLIGGSVNATEHSVMCAGGKESERETYRRLLTKFPEGILSVVSDTWDLWHVLTVILPELKPLILSRKGKLVIRPDSGDPVKILCGDSDAPADSPARKGVIALLWDLFGGTTTSTGHRLLDSHIGAIYGDGISYERADAIMGLLRHQGFASANIVLGLGSYTYQYVTRDTYNIAMKATWVQIDGESLPIYKRPVTDNGMKFSATGRLAVLKDAAGKYYVVENATPEQEGQSELCSTFKDGQFVLRVTFDEVRKRALATG